MGHLMIFHPLSMGKFARLCVNPANGRMDQFPRTVIALRPGLASRMHSLMFQDMTGRLGTAGREYDSRRQEALQPLKRPVARSCTRRWWTPFRAYTVRDNLCAWRKLERQPQVVRVPLINIQSDLYGVARNQTTRNNLVVAVDEVGGLVGFLDPHLSTGIHPASPEGEMVTEQENNEAK